jgi:hypothetical protein
MQIIVTDLTRFNNREILCLAGLTKNGQECIRPLLPTSPGYLTFARCKKDNILPGTILDGNFTTPRNIEAPHIEDKNFSQLKVVGKASANEFKAVLEASSTSSIRNGFGCTTQITNKVIAEPPTKSIITLKINPTDFKVVLSKQRNEEKIKAHLTDGDGVSLSFLSITDLGFFDNVGQADTSRTSAEEITEFIHEQDELFIRLGLSRWFKSPQGIEGYWMQVNGIYTFPNYQQIVRSY